MEVSLPTHFSVFPVWKPTPHSVHCAGAVEAESMHTMMVTNDVSNLHSRQSLGYLVSHDDIMIS